MSLVAGMARVNPRQTAMRPHFLDVEYAHAVRGKNLLGGPCPEVREVLVVDPVDPVACERPEQVREFRGADAVRLQDDANALDERVEVRSLGEEIVAQNEIALDAGFSQLACRLYAKQLHQCRNSTRFGRPSNVRCGFDSESGNAPLYEGLQQIPVISAELDDTVRRPYAESRGRWLYVSLCVIEPCIRIGRKICIFRKDFAGRYVFLKLHKKAVAADVDNKGV